MRSQVSHVSDLCFLQRAPAVTEMLPTAWVTSDADISLTFTSEQCLDVICVSLTKDQQGLGDFIFKTEINENNYFYSVFALLSVVFAETDKLYRCIHLSHTNCTTPGKWYLM